MAQVVVQAVAWRVAQQEVWKQVAWEAWVEEGEVEEG